MIFVTNQVFKIFFIKRNLLRYHYLVTIYTAYSVYVNWVFRIVKITHFNLNLTKGQNFFIHLLYYSYQKNYLFYKVIFLHHNSFFRILLDFVIFFFMFISIFSVFSFFFFLFLIEIVLYIDLELFLQLSFVVFIIFLCFFDYFLNADDFLRVLIIFHNSCF